MMCLTIRRLAAMVGVAFASLLGGVVLGASFADDFVLFGRVDFLAGGGAEQIVRMKKDVSVVNAEGESEILRKGDYLILEGKYDFQRFLSKRYIINDPSVFEIMEGESGATLIEPMN